MGGTRGSQFQLHIHSSPLAVERLRNYLQPFTFHALSAISPFFVDGVSNQLRNFCTLRFPAPPHTHTRRYSHFTSVQFFLAYYLRYKSATSPTAINHLHSFCGKKKVQLLPYFAENRCARAIFLHTQVTYHRHKLIYRVFHDFRA